MCCYGIAVLVMLLVVGVVFFVTSGRSTGLILLGMQTSNPGKHSIYDTKLKTDVAIPKHRQAVYTARYTAEDICVTQKSYAGKLRETESR